MPALSVPLRRRSIRGLEKDGLVRRTVDLSDISTEMEAAAVWLESNGVRQASSRIEKDREHFRRLNAARDLQALREASRTARAFSHLDQHNVPPAGLANP